MHVNLREFELMFPKKTLDSTDSLGSLNIGSQSTNRFLFCMQHLNISSNMCDLGNCLCGGLTKLPCQLYWKEIHIGDLIAPPKRGRPLAICVPPPPSLETFILRNYDSFYITHIKTAICFSTPKWSNVVRYVDVASNGISSEVSSKLSITGVPQLRFVNLQGNEMIFSGENINVRPDFTGGVVAGKQ